MNKFSPLATIFSAIFLATFPLRSFALEISYPPFFPLTDTTSAPDLIKIFYQGMLGIGIVVAGSFVVILGFRILTSRGNISKTLETREQILHVLVGLAILVGAILLLRTINPEIATIQIGTIKFGVPPAPLLPTVTSTKTNEAAFDIEPLGRTLDQTDVFLNKMDPELSGASLDPDNGEPYYPDLLNDPYFSTPGTKSTLGLLEAVVQEVSSGLASCSSSLCLYPNPIPYKTWHHTSCQIGTDPYGNPIYGDCSSCGDLQSCTTNICTGDPCPDRSDANSLLADIPTSFEALQTFWLNTIKPERDAIINCVTEQNQGYATFLTYGSALLMAQQPDGTNAVATDCSDPNKPCSESTDFFCTNAVTSTGQFTRLHLSLNDPTIARNGLLQKEEDLIKDIQGQSSSLPAALRGNGVNEDMATSSTSCACGNTQATSSSCSTGDVCDVGNPISCTTDKVPGTESKGCYATTWTKLQELVDISTRMENLHDMITNEMNFINPLIDIELASSSSTYQSIYIKPCSSAKTIATSICPQTTEVPPTICCPNAYTKNDILQCENEDFYTCLIASHH